MPLLIVFAVIATGIAVWAWGEVTDALVGNLVVEVLAVFLTLVSILLWIGVVVYHDKPSNPCAYTVATPHGKVTRYHHGKIQDYSGDADYVWCGPGPVPR